MSQNPFMINPQMNPMMNPQQMNPMMNPQMYPMMNPNMNPVMNTQFYQAQIQLQHKTMLQRNIQAVYEWQLQPELTATIQLIQSNLAQMKEEVKLATNQEGISTQDEQSIRQVNERCSKIKQKNEELLTRTLNMKERLTRLMYMSRQKNPERETEFNLIQQKIRRLKVDIGTKIHGIKLNQEKKVREKKHNTSPENTVPFKMVLTELKDGAQVLQMQTIKARDEMSLLIKHLTEDLNLR